MQNFVERKEAIQDWFSSCTGQEGAYQRLMELGNKLAPLSQEEREKAKRVPGCQSETYLYLGTANRRLFCKACSDALIAKGLSYLVVSLHDGLLIEEVLVTDLSFLRDMGIFSHLSMNRSHGLNSMVTFLKREAVQILRTCPS
ncbi:MAG: SufE family protein [Chlamydiota bacterium]